MGENIPRISVVMPVYNVDEYLSEAVESILNQTFSDLELIIICDDPTEKTRIILDKYLENDYRVNVYYQERQGLVKSRNIGNSLASGEYIAIMDADDISLPDRLKKQVEFMDNNPEIGISGTWIRLFGDIPYFDFKRPCDHDTIVSQLLFGCSIAQPSVIIRREIFSKNGLCYSQEETHAEDYGLWVRAASVLRLANIPQVYLYYRIHNSTTFKSTQKDVSNKIRLSQIRQLCISPTSVEFETHESLSCSVFGKTKEFTFNAKSWLEKLQDANLREKIYPEPAFSSVLVNYWYSVCFKSVNLGLDSYRLFHSSKLSKSANLSSKKEIMLLLRPNIKYLKNLVK